MRETPLKEAERGDLAVALRGILRRLDALENSALSRSRMLVTAARRGIEGLTPTDPRPSDLDFFIRGIDAQMAMLAGDFEDLIAGFAVEAGSLGEEFAGAQLRALGIDPAKFAGQGLSSSELVTTARVLAAEASTAIGETSARIQADVARAFLAPKPKLSEIRNAIAQNLITRRRDGSLSGAIAKIATKLRGSVGAIFGQASQAVQKAAEESGEPIGKIWVKKPPRVRPTHSEAAARYRVNGNPGPIPIDDFFVIGGVKLRFPRDPQAVSVGGSVAGEVANCKCECVIVPMPKSKARKSA